MRRLRYNVAISLDGFIAGANGEYDWIVMDPAVDFTALFKDFDTLLMGRRTYELASKGPGATMPGMQTVVCSRTLRSADCPDVTVTADAAETVATLKAKLGKDIWLFGGGALFRGLLDARLVDTIEVGVMLVLAFMILPNIILSAPVPLCVPCVLCG
jgi:dihydrofolate reductase